ncbi:hypothetical protein T439DRAFT_22505 [Meredithblackwellia eburnea MCA 4105]
MGQGESQPQEGKGQNSTGVAFHVLRVAEQSPAAEAGIDPFFDFICGVNGRPLGDEIDTLTQVLEKSEGLRIVLQVYSTKRKELRDVDVIPSRSWSSDGASDGGQPSLLGLSLRLCHPHAALEQVWHVLEILEGSPAQSAGLVPFGDWIVGYAGGVLRGEGDFYDVVEAHVDKPLRLFVYNADYDVTREAILVPNRSWGGEGLLGCGVGYGLLHRIPKPQDHSGFIHRGAHGEENEDEDDGDDEGQTMMGAGARTRRGRDSEGFVEASYDQHQHQHYHAGGAGGIGSQFGEYAVSEGVQVVPVEEEAGFNSFRPSDGVRGQNVGYGGKGYGYSPRRASVVPREAEGIAEEEESMV